MTADRDVFAIVDALGLPPEARLDARVPKKLLIEQGAPTNADKRVIQDGIDELQWLAACKPNTIGVPAFTDETRDYLEIAVVACAFRPASKLSRLIELIHRAIPYPVLLVTSEAAGVSFSVGHKRHARNEAGKVVIERVVTCSINQPDRLDAQEQAFLKSLALALQPRRDLFILYESWLSRIEALNAARLIGSFSAIDDANFIERRRVALEAHANLTREIAGLRTKAAHEKQLGRRVDLNLEIKRRQIELEQQIAIMKGSS